MKRGQVGLGLIIFAIVAIIAVIGLVLLFSRASAAGASIGNVYGGQGQATPYDAGNIAAYQGGQNKGIAYTYPSPKAEPSMGRPETAYPYPAPADIPTKGTRTPAFIVDGYTSLEDMYGCERDLTVGSYIGVPHDQFNCYAVPVKGPTEEVEGFYDRASAAYDRPTKGTIGKTGGNMYCYANPGGAGEWADRSEDLIRKNIINGPVKHPTGYEKFGWDTVMMNGIEVPRCWVSQKEFPFPQ